MFDLKVLNREVTEKILKLPQVIETVEEVYKQKAKGQTTVFPLVSHEFEAGKAEMDIKSGWLKEKDIFGLKVVSWFCDNPKRNLPALTGMIMVLDGKTGVPQGILDGGYITGMRTGAAGAIGAKALARPESKTMMIVGTGQMATFQVAATLCLFPQMETVLVYNKNSREHGERFVETMPAILKDKFALERPKVDFRVVDDLIRATGESDIIITATPSKEPIVRREWVKPGTHFSCVGADMAGKEEIDPQIFAGARVFTDDTPQCIDVGEIEIPINMGILKKDDIAGEIGQILLGQIPGRENEEQITVFDTTGTALLDLLTAKLALETAEKENLGQVVRL